MLRTERVRKESPVELWEDLSHELWQVQHGLGEPKLMTVEEIDAAFKRDEVNERTLVRKQGSLQWKTLGELAGIDMTNQLESESLMPVTSSLIESVTDAIAGGLGAGEAPNTIDVLNPVIPKPPPLPRRSSQDSIPTAKVDVPAVVTRSPTPRPASKHDDDVMVAPQAGEEGAIFHLSRPKKKSRQPLTSDADREERRARSTGGKLVGIALVALVGGGMFAGVSAWLAGSFDRPHTAPAVAALPPPAPTAEPSVKTLAPVTVEGSILVLAPTAQRDAAAAPAAPAPKPVIAAAAPKAAAKAPAPTPTPTPKASVGLKIDAKKTLVVGKAPPPQHSHAKAKTR